MKIIDSPSGAHIVIDGRHYLNFAGSCYLGICGEESILAAAKAAIERNGAFAQIPKHYGMSVRANVDCEAVIADFFGEASGIYFIGGYLFGAMAFQGLRNDFDAVYLDASAHFALQDGARTAGKPVHTFRHCDPADLARVIAETLPPGQVPAVGCDGIFPTSGEISPLDRYYAVVEPLGGYVVVDESHALGVLGDHGRGAVEKFGLPRSHVVGGGSSAKGFCAYGGMSAGPKDLMDKLVWSPPGRGASAGMTGAAAATAASLRYVLRHPELLVGLREKIVYFRRALRAVGVGTPDSESPVVSFQIGDAATMQRLQQELFEEQGIFVLYSTYIGAGPEGVLRTAIFADHSIADIDRLVAALRPYL